MSQRINISVPDDLYVQIQLFKTQLNISKICQEAIQKAVKIEELKCNTEDEVDKLALRFQQERRKHGQGFWNEGFSDGQNDAFWTGFKWLYTIWTHKDSETPENLFKIGATKNTISKIQKHQFITDFDFFVSFDHVKDLYFEGWLKGALATWMCVSDKLDLSDSHRQKGFML